MVGHWAQTWDAIWVVKSAALRAACWGASWDGQMVELTALKWVVKRAAMKVC